MKRASDVIIGIYTYLSIAPIGPSFLAHLAACR
jgi:hypothetical protein